MIAIPKSRKNSKKNVEVSEPIPIPIPVPVVAPVETKPEGVQSTKTPSYRQRLIQKVGIEAVREKERLSRQATKERKAQSIPVS